MRVSSMDLILLLQSKYLIGGSYVVNPDTANDIDVVVHEYHAKEHYTGFHRLSEGDKKYDEIDHVRLISVHEGIIGGDKYNIIVVGAVFWPAYVGAIAEMRHNPELYSTRDERIELHRELSRQVAAIAKVELPSGAE